MIAELPEIASSVSVEEALALRELAAGALVLEVGSWRGFSTVTMAQVAQRVDAVDHHLGDEHAGHDESLSYLMRNLDAYDVRDRVVVHVGAASEVLPYMPRGHFDVAFIDAYHTRPAVERDAELVRPLVHHRGVVAFHDYGDERFGVTAAVDELSWLEPARVVGTLWIGTKR